MYQVIYALTLSVSLSSQGHMFNMYDQYVKRIVDAKCHIC